MTTLRGDFGEAVFSNSTDSANVTTNRYLTLDLKSSLIFFRKIAMLKTNIVQNSLGLFSFARGMADGKVHFASLSTPKHLFKKRSNGCAFKSKGKMQMSTSSFNLCPIEYNGELCSDMFLGKCLEQIYGAGNGVRDFLSSPAGTAIFSEMMYNIYSALGNSFYDLVMWGQHELIDESDANDWYTVDDDEWDDYKEQQDACAGIMTAIDLFKNQGYKNLGVEIFRKDLNADLTAYIGKTEELFKRMKECMSPEMRKISKRGLASNGSNMTNSHLLVHPIIFERYEEEMLEKWENLPKTMEYYFNGAFCVENGCSALSPVEGVLKWKGHWLVCMDEWRDFDEITGTITIRAMFVTPGNFAVGFDTPSLNQFGGFGLRLNQKLEVGPEQGKVYMDTTFKVGTGLIDPLHITMASKTWKPTALQMSLN